MVFAGAMISLLLGPLMSRARGDKRYTHTYPIFISMSNLKLLASPVSVQPYQADLAFPTNRSYLEFLSLTKETCFLISTICLFVQASIYIILSELLTHTLDFTEF